MSWKWEVKARSGLARLDYTQNAINKTLVAPYSPAAGPRGAGLGADRRGTSSTTRDLRPDRWTIRTVLDRLAERGDPFRALLGAARSCRRSAEPAGPSRSGDILPTCPRP